MFLLFYEDLKSLTNQHVILLYFYAFYNGPYFQITIVFSFFPTFSKIEWQRKFSDVSPAMCKLYTLQQNRFSVSVIKNDSTKLN